MVKQKSATTVTVFCNLPNGITFQVPGGENVTFTGTPVSALVGLDGKTLPAGQYGKTRRVPVDTWEYVRKTYKDMELFKANPQLIFAEPDLETGEEKAADLAGTLHGFEQVDPLSTKTTPEPATSQNTGNGAGA